MSRGLDCKKKKKKNSKKKKHFLFFVRSFSPARCSRECRRSHRSSGPGPCLPGSRSRLAFMWRRR